MMTNTSDSPTQIQQLRDLAAKTGWRETDQGSIGIKFSRSSKTVIVHGSTNGRVVKVKRTSGAWNEPVEIQEPTTDKFKTAMRWLRYGQGVDDHDSEPNVPADTVIETLPATTEPEPLPAPAEAATEPADRKTTMPTDTESAVAEDLRSAAASYAIALDAMRVDVAANVAALHKGKVRQLSNNAAELLVRFGELTAMHAHARNVLPDEKIRAILEDATRHIENALQP